MAHVKVLSQDVISKIAAGEVVDRPASVVKELIENALDAGADRVEVHLKSGGKSLIQVKDNGSGIGRADLERMFTRHATSKITTSDDLDALVSLGFRGEALYSIAAVSEVTVRTKTDEKQDGWETFLRGGVRERLAPVALASRGTEIRVEEIFFNTPARKKFLKADASELDAVMNVVLPYALQLPDKHFILTNNERVLLDLPVVKTHAERAAKALNLNVRHILEDEAFIKDEGILIRLVLGDINIQRPRRDLQYLFVNGRPIAHKNLMFHVNDVYRLVMPEGVHPFFIVFIDVPATEVDVNIHPQKREVRLKPEARVASLLRQAVERVLMTKGGAKETGGALSEPLFAFDPFEAKTPQGISSERIIFAPGQSGAASLMEPRSESNMFQPSGSTPMMQSPSFGASGAAQPSLKDQLAGARFVGNFARKYHLFESGESLFAVDQHAAQERILYERILAQSQKGEVDVQTLLVPVPVRLSVQEMLRWESARDVLTQCGLETSLLDPSTISVHSHPRLVKNVELFLRALVSEEPAALFNKDFFARRACRASVMTGDAMSCEQAVFQLRELLSCEDAMTCPHGRPVFIEFKKSFFDRQFLRI